MCQNSLTVCACFFTLIHYLSSSVTFAETLLDNLRLRNESAVTIHANYLSGNGKKQARLREHGLWLATIDDDNTKYECATYVPPQPDWKYHAQS